MSACTRAFSIFAVLGAIVLFPAPAGAGTDAVVCDNPSVARDLIGVMARPAVFSEWLHGYLESGHCVPVDSERLGLQVPDGGERSVIRYAIMLPEVLLHADD
jgi:hypothetical protein